MTFHHHERCAAGPSPVALLSYASTLVAAVDRRGHSAAGPAVPTVAEFCTALDDVGLRQTDALLRVVSTLSGDELQSERMRRRIAERRHPLPGWVLRLDQVQPHRAYELQHVLRGGDNVVIGVHLPGNHEITIVIYIDHNLGTLVKDAFLQERSIDDFLLRWAEVGAESGQTIPGLSERERDRLDSRPGPRPGVR